MVLNSSKTLKTCLMDLKESVQGGVSSEALNAYLLVFYESPKPIPIMWSILHCLFWGWSPPRWKRPPELLECVGAECLHLKRDINILTKAAYQVFRIPFCNMSFIFWGLPRKNPWA
jgi:hypothetical protein